MHDLRGGFNTRIKFPKDAPEEAYKACFLVHIPLMITLGRYLNWDISQDLKEMQWLKSHHLQEGF